MCPQGTEVVVLCHCDRDSQCERGCGPWRTLFFFRVQWFLLPDFFLWLSRNYEPGLQCKKEIEHGVVCLNTRVCACVCLLTTCRWTKRGGGELCRRKHVRPETSSLLVRSPAKSGSSSGWLTLDESVSVFRVEWMRSWGGCMVLRRSWGGHYSNLRVISHMDEIAQGTWKRERERKKITFEQTFQARHLTE